MITLNSERGLIRVDSWNDVTDQPGFRVSVDHKKHKLLSIIGKYTLHDRVPCGLSSCRTAHGKGFVVSLEGGLISNIGKDCGKTHFGVDFETMSRAFDRDVRMLDWREKILAFQNTLPSLSQQISDLRQSEGGDWVYKKSQLFRSTSCPQPVRDSLTRMIRERDGRVIRERLETEAEAAAREAMQYSERDDEEKRIPRRQWIREQIGQIEGLTVLYPEMDLRTILIVQALPRLKTIKDLIVTNMTERELRENAKWIDGAEAMLRRAATAIQDGKKFLRQANLAPLRALLSQPGELQEFDKLVRDLPP